MIRAGAWKRESKSHIYPFVKRMEFQWDEPLYQSPLQFAPGKAHGKILYSGAGREKLRLPRKRKAHLMQAFFGNRPRHDGGQVPPPRLNRGLFQIFQGLLSRSSVGLA